MVVSFGAWATQVRYRIACARNILHDLKSGRETLHVRESFLNFFDMACSLSSAPVCRLQAPAGQAHGRQKVRTEVRPVFNDIAPRLEAVLAGIGLAYLPDDEVLACPKNGRLVRVLDDWCPPFSDRQPPEYAPEASR